MENHNKFLDITLDILDYQIRQGVHVSNVKNLENTIKKLQGKINKIHEMELNGVINQIKLDINRSNMDRSKANYYKDELQGIIQKIRNY